MRPEPSALSHVTAVNGAHGSELHSQSQPLGQFALPHQRSQSNELYIAS
jgi:hypothetical protein